jgi:hypothetical protein
MDGGELRRLMGMMWFRTVVLGRLSAHWRQRVLDVLIDSAAVPDHAVKLGRQTMHLRELSFEQLQEVGAKTMVPDWIQADLDLLITVGRFWGPDAVKRFHFVDPPERREPSVMESLLDKTPRLTGSDGLSSSGDQTIHSSRQRTVCRPDVSRSGGDDRL